MRNYPRLNTLSRQPTSALCTTCLPRLRVQDTIQAMHMRHLSNGTVFLKRKASDVFDSVVIVIAFRLTQATSKTNITLAEDQTQNNALRRRMVRGESGLEEYVGMWYSAKFFQPTFSWVITLANSHPF